MEKLNIFSLKFLPIGLDSAPFEFGEIIHPLINYWHKNLLKIACLDEGLSPLESFFEAIPSLHFVQKFDFVVNGENPIWETQEVMAETGKVLVLRNKTFSHK